nr:uncharacterized protein LOC111506204 [Leptinotarsa decemlineata]
MQPLDKSVFGPLKTYFNQATNEKLMTPGHIGKPLTIYDIADLVGKAFPPAFIPMNIANGFKATGFHPLNENIFSDADFLAANFSDRPLSQEISTQPDRLLPEESSAQADKSLLQEPPVKVGHLWPPESCAQTGNQLTPELVQESSDQPEMSLLNISDIPHKFGPSSSKLITTEIIRQHPKAAPRKGTHKGRPKGKSRILTDTPEKNAIEALKTVKKVALKDDRNLKIGKNKEQKKTETSSLTLRILTIPSTTLMTLIVKIKQ